MELVSLDNPMDRGAWWATVHWVTKTLTRLKWFSTRACMFSDQESYNSDMVQGIHGAPCAKGYNTGNLDIHAKGMLDTLWYTDQLESFWKRMKYYHMWSRSIAHCSFLTFNSFKWCLFVIFFCFRFTLNLYSMNFRLWNLVPLTIFHAVFAQNSLWGICLKTLLIWSHVSSTSWFLPFVYVTLGSWRLHLFLLLIYL